jgi:hypothetical protein
MTLWRSGLSATRRGAASLRRRVVTAPLTFALLAAGACSTPAAPTPGASDQKGVETVTEIPRASSPAAPSRQVIRIRVGSQSLSAQLEDSSATRDLVSLLPLALVFRDFGGQEKLATLPRKLDVSGMPKGDRASAGDIGYYSPSESLVLYYKDVGYWEGIVRLGRLNDQLTLIAGLPDGLQGIVERMD